MDDKKLLELAAKAVGIEHPGGDHCINGPALWDCRRLCWWRPLADDGDALRLAVALEITPGKHEDTIVASRSASWRNGAAQCSLWEPAGNDPYAATRRAIVRAAAEIGKAMP